MIRELPVGIQTNGIKHSHQDPMPSIDTRFAMVRESGVFDYVDKTPDPDEVESFERASEKYGIPVRCGGWYYVFGRDEPLLSRNLEPIFDVTTVAYGLIAGPRSGARQYPTDSELGSSRRQPRLDHLQTEHYRVCCPVVSAPGSAPTLTTCFPKLPPSSIAIKAAGAFSSPSVISIL